MPHVPSIFGINVFGDSAMREYLPEDIYKSLRRTIEQGRSLQPDIAMDVANGMKEWAVKKGATHYSHWFQPMTGVTAEKHDSFITPTGDGRVIMEFSGKELIKGEPDASSLPSGGLRCTFEARGYTAWDPSSYAFLKNGTLYIPTAFFSYSGESLDKKTPLLRSMQALNKQALRILRCFGNDTSKRVIPTVGAEQEYFLIDRELYLKRRDLIYTGRTLFGAKPPKGQELDDHYFGNIKEHVSGFMKELDEEMWKLGVLAKTKHNESAPAQHEFSPIFTTANIATDQNSLAMELLKKVANRHKMECLLHEKPFSGVNGSGKHINWSIVTDDGYNLLDPGESPAENAQFLIFLSAVVEAVDEYAGLLRFSVASAGNDLRLGGGEAPPSIISIFLGEQLTDILRAITQGEASPGADNSVIEIGVKGLPKLPKDTTDRNRTSPFAFTGNRFEFRMPGASFSVADPNTMLNTAVAEILRRYADTLEQAGDINRAAAKIVSEMMKNHSKIIFNGNSYSAEWTLEAEKRGLPNLRDTVESIPELLNPKNAEMLYNHGVLSRNELQSRYEIILEIYAKQVNIEALTTLELARRDILPAVLKFTKDLSEAMFYKQNISVLSKGFESLLLTKINKDSSELYSAVQKLDTAIAGTPKAADVLEKAKYLRDAVLPAMNRVRELADTLEENTGREYWPLPAYGDLLFQTPEA